MQSDQAIRLSREQVKQIFGGVDDQHTTQEQPHTVPTPSRRAEGYHVYKVRLNGFKSEPVEYVIMADTIEQAEEEAKTLALRKYDRVGFVSSERMDKP